MRLMVLLIVLSQAPALVGQEPVASSAKPRVVTVLAGTGNDMGWFGLQGEHYFAGDRFSGFLGLGYTPAVVDGDPSGPTFAAGIRGFTAGLKHRGFLEISISQLVTVSGPPEDQARLYGPGVQAGYQFVSMGGFSLMLSLGIGYAPGVSNGESKTGAIGGLGFGYTWRH